MSNTLRTMKIDQIFLFRVENKNNTQLLAPGQPGPHHPPHARDHLSSLYSFPQKTTRSLSL